MAASFGLTQQARDDVAISTACRVPRAGRPRGPAHRQVVVPAYPYVVVYRYDAAANFVTVVAVFHASRDPTDLLDRLT